MAIRVRIANWNAHELNVVNAGGWAFLSPGASEFPELPPLKAFGHQGDYQGGLHACFAALAAYFHRLDSGKGQVLEVSQQECIAGMLEMNLMHYTYAGRETSRLGTRVLGPWKIMETADGHILAVCVEEDQWRRLVELMGDPEWAHEEVFQDRLARGRNADALYAADAGMDQRMENAGALSRSAAAPHPVRGGQPDEGSVRQ